MVTSHDIICHEGVSLNRSSNLKLKKITLFNLATLTLTSKLIRDMVKIHPYIKYWVCKSNGSSL